MKTTFHLGFFPFLTACVLTTSFDGYDTAPRAPLYGLSGTVDGLEGGTAALLLNGVIAATVSDGAFDLPRSLPDGAAFEVTTSAQGFGCGVAGGTGRVAQKNVTGIAIHCRSSDASLVDLSISAGPLTPVFSTDTRAYAVTGAIFPLAAPATTVTARAKRADATITVNGVPTQSGMPTDAMPFTLGANQILVRVTAADGQSTLTYTVVPSGVDAPSDYLKASNTTTAGAANPFIGAWFGYSLALSGNTLAVGSPRESSGATGINGNQSDTSAQNAGAVYLFVRSGTTWAQQAYIKASNQSTSIYGSGRYFGQSVALAGDTLAVGSPGESSNATGIDGNQADTSAPWAGAVYIFRRTGSTWTQQAYIKASNTQSNAGFGTAVAVSSDTLAVAAPGSGGVYIFTRTTAWQQQANFNASVAAGENSVALAGLGDVLAIGSSGKAFVFSRSGSVWSQQASIAGGAPVTLSATGDTLATPLSAGVSIYSRSGSVWTQQTLLTVSTASGFGSALVFARSNAAWSQLSNVKASNACSGCEFGISVALSSQMLVVGADRERGSSMGINGDQKALGTVGAGAAYAYY